MALKFGALALLLVRADLVSVIATCPSHGYPVDFASNLGVCLKDFAEEVLAHIFKFCSMQDRLKIACVCKRFKDVIDSTGEIWRIFNTDDELTIHQFDLIIIIVKHTRHLTHVSVRFSQKCVHNNSPDLYIESALAMCKHLTYLDLSTTLVLLFWTSLLE